MVRLACAAKSLVGSSLQSYLNAHAQVTLRHMNNHVNICVTRGAHTRVHWKVCVLQARIAQNTATHPDTLSPSAVNLKSPPRKESETVEKMAINRPRAPKFFTLKIR